MSTFPYFPHSEGLGTTYEACVSRRFLNSFVAQNGVKTVCEYPICTFRVPGSIGIQLAAMGCHVTLASTDGKTLARAKELADRFELEGKTHFVRIGRDPIRPESFDLVFQMSTLPTMQRELGLNPFQCLREIARIAKRYVIVTNHNLHYSVPLDRLLSKGTGTSPQFGRLDLVGPMPLRNMMRTVGLSIVAELFLDVPPWMALDISKVFPNVRTHTTRGLSESHSRAVEAAMRRYSLFEGTRVPALLKRFLAHHVAIIAEKRIEAAPLNSA